MLPQRRSTDPYAVIYLRHKGKLTLSEIVDLILKGDQVCVNGLLKTLRDTTAAKDVPLHIQVVKKLAGKCAIIEGLLLNKDFDQKIELLQAFADLQRYAGTGIYPKFH